MGTKYLQFEDHQQATDVLIAAGCTISEHGDHFVGNGWGTIFPIPGEEGIFVNVYDCPNNDFAAYEIQVDGIPYNVVAVKQDY